MELCVVVPTFNEVQNIQPMVERLSLALERIEWEVVFVDDDSSDGTADVIRAVALDNIRVRCLQRIGRRGLSTAVIEGMCSTGATYLAVIDGDLQHDESLLPKMLSTLKSEGVDIVLGSRYIVGGSTGAWEESRARISALANRLSRLIIKTELSDPMSGFFMLRRDAFFSAVRRLSGLGFKSCSTSFCPRRTRYVTRSCLIRSDRGRTVRANSTARSLLNTCCFLSISGWDMLCLHVLSCLQVLGPWGLAYTWRRYGLASAW